MGFSSGPKIPSQQENLDAQPRTERSGHSTITLCWTGLALQIELFACYTICSFAQAGNPNRMWPGLESHHLAGISDSSASSCRSGTSRRQKSGP